MYIYVHIYVHIYVIINVIIQGQLSYLTSLLDHVLDPTRTPCGTYTRTYIRTYYLILKGSPTHPSIPPYLTPTRPTRTYTCKYIGPQPASPTNLRYPVEIGTEGVETGTNPRNRARSGKIGEDRKMERRVRRDRKVQRSVPAPTFNAFQIFYFLKILNMYIYTYIMALIPKI